tara:strand:- start:2622 stop:2927 length:306 start_codon:yes stop_codon:yes gene_type:complete
MDFFKIAGIAETCSTISLFFIAMPMKYIGENEILVKIIGPIHGLLWMIYLALLWWGQYQGRWNMKAVITGGILSIPPGGPIWFEPRIGDEKYLPVKTKQAN